MTFMRTALTPPLCPSGQTDVWQCRAGPDQFGARGKIFAGAPYPFGSHSKFSHVHTLRETAKLCL